MVPFPSMRKGHSRDDAPSLGALSQLERKSRMIRYSDSNEGGNLPLLPVGALQRIFSGGERMSGYIAKRVLLFIPTLILVTLLVFVLMRIIPGDPAVVYLVGESGDQPYTQEQLEILQKKLGSDKPIHIEYGTWLWGLLRGDLGVSTYYETPIAEDLVDKVPVTLELALLALLLAIVAAVPLGILSAIMQDTPLDYIARVVAIGGVALPTFWVGILVIYFLVLLFDWLPPFGYAHIWEDPGKNLQQVIFPALALGFYNMALIARSTRSAMLEVFREDYIRTARSKGLREHLIITRHALKNAFLPVLTLAGWQFGMLLAGTVIIEEIFVLPGIGSLLIDRILKRDFATVQATVMMITVMVLLLNLVIDLIYGWLDPRIRYE